MNKLDYSKLEILTPQPVQGENKMSDWQQANPEIQKLITALFETRPDASESELVKAGLAFIEKCRKLLGDNARDMQSLESLSARVDALATSMLSPTDLSVCKQLGLTPAEFLKTR